MVKDCDHRPTLKFIVEGAQSESWLECRKCGEVLTKRHPSAYRALKEWFGERHVQRVEGAIGGKHHGTEN